MYANSPPITLDTLCASDYGIGMDIRTDLERLIRQADGAARWRGHSLNWRQVDERRAVGDCRCGNGVSVDTHPAPNGIDIGGPAVAVNHPMVAEWCRRADAGVLVSKDMTGGAA